MSVIAGMKKLLSRMKSAKSQSGEKHAKGHTEQQNTAGQEASAYISDPDSPSIDSQSIGDGIIQDEVAVAAAEPEAKSQPKAKASLLPPYDGPVLEVRNVHRSFQTGSRIIHVLKGIDMEVNPQQLVMLKGRSGSGKTTLLNMLGGLDQPSSGDILFSGQPLQDWGDRKRTSAA